MKYNVFTAFPDPSPGNTCAFLRKGVSKINSLIAIAAFVLPVSSQAQDTFSICAVDSVTGEVGSAGASCIDASVIPGGCVIISDVHNGVGVIHTQASYVSPNQFYANGLMQQGLQPQQIIDSLVANDFNNNPSVRQYGIVKLYNGGVLVAAYTGANCMNYKNHIIGPNYSIQGNILLNQGILDSMEARFLNTPGDLACKLMAAMQGAKVVGADTRCTSSGNSSLSSFLRVACPNDQQGAFSIDLLVPEGPPGFEPIDSLQALFNNVHNCSAPLQCPTSVGEIKGNGFTVEVMPNPFSDVAVLKVTGSKKTSYRLELYNNHGQLVLRDTSDFKTEYSLGKEKLLPGIYYYRVTSAEGKTLSGKVIAR